MVRFLHFSPINFPSFNAFFFTPSTFPILMQFCPINLTSFNDFSPMNFSSSFHAFLSYKPSLFSSISALQILLPDYHTSSVFHSAVPSHAVLRSPSLSPSIFLHVSPRLFSPADITHINSFHPFLASLFFESVLSPFFQCGGDASVHSRLPLF